MRPLRLKLEHRTTLGDKRQLHLKWGGFNQTERSQLAELMSRFADEVKPTPKFLLEDWKQRQRSSIEQQPENWVLARIGGKPVHAINARAFENGLLKLNWAFTVPDERQKGITFNVVKGLVDAHNSKAVDKPLRTINFLGFMNKDFGTKLSNRLRKEGMIVVADRLIKTD